MPKSQHTATPTSADETEITLGLLNAVHNNSAVTQRSVASELGIALGLANSYLKRCVKKGLIKINQAPANRYAYYLTPKGFAEKSQLTAEYLTMSFDFFRHAKTHCVDVFELCEFMNLRRVGLVGASDLAEIAVLCARDFDVELVGFIDPAFEGTVFSGLPVFPRTEDIGDIDAFVITDLFAPQETFMRLHEETSNKPILSPRMLNISRPDAAGEKP